MIITNDFTEDESVLSCLRDIVAVVSPVKVNTKRPDRKRLKTRYIQPRGVQEVFYKLLTDWRGSKSNFLEFFKKHPHLQQRMLHGKTILYVARDGSSGHIAWTPLTSPPESEVDGLRYQSDEDRALDLFMRFITNPKQDALAGPCALEECRRLFLKKSKHSQIYCSKRCSSAATAVPSIQKKRLETRQEKIALAERSIKEWLALSIRRREWKSWVEKRTCSQQRVELRLTRKWLTQAVNKGDVLAPQI